jgi:hypothetical protein
MTGASMHSFSRRDAVFGLATAAAAVGSSTTCAFAGQQPTYAAAPRTPMDVYAKIRCSLGPELVPFWYRGEAMVALQDDMPRPLLGVEGFSYTRFTRKPDGSWMTKLIEVGYFFDLHNGTIVDETVNPLNGKTIRPKHFISPPQVFAVQHDGTMVAEHKLAPPAEFSGRVGAPFRQGPEVWVDEDELARLSSDALPPSLRDEGPPKPLVLGSMTTYRARAADVDDPRLANAPCTFHLQELSSLPHWFEMGDVVGKQMWRLSGRKLASPAEIPAPLRARIERDHPKFIAEPGI